MSAEEPLTPAETRAADLLADLRAVDPPSTELVRSVTRTVRWQRPIRRALVSVGNAAGSIAGGLLFLVRRRP